MYRKILVPLDGSEASEGALPYAADLAKRSEGSLDLVLVASQRPAAECEAYLEEVAEQLTGLPLLRRVPGGPDVTQAILDCARGEAVDLVAMTTHGREGLARASLGSVAEHVVRRAACPVLVVPRPALGRPNPDFKRILVTLDGSKLSEGALDEAIVLARQYAGELKLLRVATEPDPAVFPESEQGIQGARAYLERIAAVAAVAGVPCSICFPVSLLPEEVIVSEAQGCNLIVMASHGRGGLARVMLGSICDKVLRHAPCPTLVLNRPVLEARRKD